MPIPAATALPVESLIVPTPDGIASRVLGRTAGGSLTLFAFDAGQALTEHTSPYEAYVQVLEGTFVLTIGGTRVDAPAGALVRMPANVPHAVEAASPARMLLVMLKGEERA